MISCRCGFLGLYHNIKCRAKFKARAVQSHLGVRLAGGTEVEKGL